MHARVIITYMCVCTYNKKHLCIIYINDFIYTCTLNNEKQSTQQEMDVALISFLNLSEVTSHLSVERLSFPEGNSFQ